MACVFKIHQTLELYKFVYYIFLPVDGRLLHKCFKTLERLRKGLTDCEEIHFMYIIYY